MYNINFDSLDFNYIPEVSSKTSNDNKIAKMNPFCYGISAISMYLRRFDCDVDIENGIDDINVTGSVQPIFGIIKVIERVPVRDGYLEESHFEIHSSYEQYLRNSWSCPVCKYALDYLTARKFNSVDDVKEALKKVMIVCQDSDQPLWNNNNRCYDDSKGIFNAANEKVFLSREDANKYIEYLKRKAEATYYKENADKYFAAVDKSLIKYKKMVASFMAKVEKMEECKKNAIMYNTKIALAAKNNPVKEPTFDYNKPYKVNVIKKAPSTGVLTTESVSAGNDTVAAIINSGVKTISPADAEKLLAALGITSIAISK